MLYFIREIGYPQSLGDGLSCHNKHYEGISSIIACNMRDRPLHQSNTSTIVCCPSGLIAPMKQEHGSGMG